MVVPTITKNLHSKAFKSIQNRHLIANPFSPGFVNSFPLHFFSSSSTLSQKPTIACKCPQTTFRPDKIYIVYVNDHLLPKNGIAAVSALAKTDNGSSRTTTSESKRDECGAKTNIGASCLVARRPIIFTLWNELAIYMPRIVRPVSVRKVLIFA